MPVTAIEIIQDALEGIGEYSPGESIDAADVNRAFKALNRMVGQWSNDHLGCFAYLHQSIPMENNKGAYTVGPSVSADVNSKRPLQLQQLWIVGNENLVWPVDLLTDTDWNLIRNTSVQSQIPLYGFYDPQDPVGIINVWPKPIPPLYTLHWTSYLQLTEFPNLTDDVDVPVGYEEAYVENLKVRLCPYFGKPVPPDIRALAMETRGTIKRTNARSQTSNIDAAIAIQYGTIFNIRTGDWNRR